MAAPPRDVAAAGTPAPSTDRHGAPGEAPRLAVPAAPLHATKTGTTIVGIVYADGIVLCADTRATNGPVVADKNCEKIHRIAERIFCCGAGTAADADRVTRRMAAALARFEQRFSHAPFVAHAERLACDYLHGYGGQIGAALVLGGMDTRGAHLFSISPNGYSAPVDFTALGSGSLAAIGELERCYRRGMSRDEAVALGVSAVRKGVLNDLFSGSNVDVCVISGEGVDFRRSYEVVESRKSRAEVVYPPESLVVVEERVIDY